MNKLIHGCTIFILMTFVACKPKSEETIKATTYDVHSELQPYVTTFEEKLILAGINKTTRHLQANFSDKLLPGQLGRCEIKGAYFKIILISKPSWDQLAVEHREMIMYHELAHCILGRSEHIPTTENGNPISVLYPYLFSTSGYVNNYGEYMAELFSNESTDMLNLEFDAINY